MILDDEDTIEDAFLFYTTKRATGDGWNPNCLAVPARCKTLEELNEIEEEYRRNFTVPVLFVDTDDGENFYVGNPGVMAEAMGVSAAGLTVEKVEAWMSAQRRAGRY